MSVSLICTVRNAEATLIPTIESVISQSAKDWEFVIVDDGSSDNTASMLNRYARLDGRIRVIRTSGIGRVAALNLAVQEAKYPLLANIDGDDLCHRRRIELQREWMQRHPQFAAVYTDVVFVMGLQQPEWLPLHMDDAKVAETGKILALYNPIVHSSVMMRRSAVLEADGYSYPHGNDDYDLWVKMLERGQRIGFLNLPLAARRLHPGQWFAHTNRFHVLKASGEVQLRAIRHFKMGASYRGLLASRMLYGILPFGLRVGLHRVLQQVRFQQASRQRQRAGCKRTTVSALARQLSSRQRN